MAIKRLLNTILGRHSREEIPRAHRYVTSVFKCQHGDLVDMSASGCRVHNHKRIDLQPGAEVMLCVKSHCQQLVVKARVAWVRSLRGDWYAGLQFVGLEPAVAEALDRLARVGFADIGSHGVSRGVRNASSGAAAASTARSSAGTNAPGNPGTDAGPIPGASAGTILTPEPVEVEDLYAILSVPSTADGPQLHEAYRRLAKRYHPDVNASLTAVERFAEITKAYAILSDKEKRARYDQLRARRPAA